MSKIKRLYFKDLNGLRFIAFLPVFFYMCLYLLKGDEESIVIPILNTIELYAINSVDFFIFLSSFLLTSIALREYKYKNNFSLKKYYMRRLFKILPLLLILFVFSFYFHDKIFSILKLTPITHHSPKNYLIGIPNYTTYVIAERFIYTIALWFVFMMLQFYFVWGIILKIFKSHMKIVGLVFIVLGITTRVIYMSFESNFTFDFFSYGVAIGIGAITADIVRNSKDFIEKIKSLTKIQIRLIYILGIFLTLGIYPFIEKSYLLTVIPLVTCVFFSFMVLEQTFGKQSIFKLRKNKLMTRFGKISYGFLIYTPIIATILLIGFESVDKGLESPLLKVLFILSTFILSWLCADISYNTYEKIFSRIKRDFKRV
jgi:peptidoglycan/LPS O-acetylase OafA/YrhL